MGNQWTPRDKKKDKKPQPKTLAAVKANSKLVTRKVGGHSKLNETMIPIIAKAMTIGTQANAAAAVGVSVTSLKKWLSIGEQIDQLPEGTDITEYEHVRWKLFVEVEKANAEFISRHVDNIENVATSPVLHANGNVKQPGDWVASMTLLERRFPDLYGRRSVIAGAGPGGSHILAVGNLDSLLKAMDAGDDKKDADVIDVKPEPESE